MIHPKILEQIEAAARKYAGREQPEVEHAFDDGTQFGFDLCQSWVSPMDSLQTIVDHQAEMESLWLMNPTITEAMLMAALRHLHAVIEGDEFAAQEAKKVYWDLESEL